MRVAERRLAMDPEAAALPSDGEDSYDEEEEELLRNIGEHGLLAPVQERLFERLSRKKDRCVPHVVCSGVCSVVCCVCVCVFCVPFAVVCGRTKSGK